MGDNEILQTGRRMTIDSNIAKADFVRVETGCYNINLASPSGQRLHVFKMILFPFVPATILIVIMAMALGKTVIEKDQLDRLHGSIGLLKSIGELVHFLQRESESTTIYLGSEHILLLSNLRSDFQMTDNALENLIIWPISNYIIDQFTSEDKFREHMKKLREEVTSKTITIEQVIKRYEATNLVFLDWFTDEVQSGSHDGIWQNLLAFKFIARAKENMFIMLSYGQEYLLTGHISWSDYQNFIKNDALALSNLESCFRFLPTTKYLFKDQIIIADIDLEHLSLMKTNIVNPDETVANAEMAFSWFTNTTELLEVFKNIEDNVVLQLEMDIQEVLRHVKIQVRKALRGYYTPILKSASFVCYLKIINTFLKSNVCILKQIVQGTQKWH